MIDVLIVDDSAAIRKILQRVLRQADVPIGTVFEAGDGREALETLKAQNVGLVLSDINMPNMDGLELLGHIKANEAWKKLPIVMVSTEGSQAKVLEAVELGAAGYVRKPFTADQIKEKLAAFF
jgi:two-component system chemotaxis response regulator CheY